MRMKRHCARSLRRVGRDPIAHQPLPCSVILDAFLLSGLQFLISSVRRLQLANNLVGFFCLRFLFMLQRFIENPPCTRFLRYLGKTGDEDPCTQKASILRKVRQVLIIKETNK
jgi:hypothetical protein